LSLAKRIRIFSTKASTVKVHAPNEAAKSFCFTESPPITQGCLGDIARHGTGDACITLNVGGKEFYTLRSTVNSNTVLADHVARAEANQEITKNGAVFIDRDPEHFNFILKYLRNRMEADWSPLQSILQQQKQKYKLQQTLPEDNKKLRELYIEAQFYQITELKDSICESSWLANLMGIFSKSGNPFDAASKFLSQLRAGLMAFGAVGGTAFVTMQEEMDCVNEKLGWKTKLPEESQVAEKQLAGA
jgi:hypothetical protein